MIRTRSRTDPSTASKDSRPLALWASTPSVKPPEHHATGPHPGGTHVPCRPDFHGALELLLTVVFKVHEPGLAEDEPALLPVPPGQRGRAAALLVQPALLEGLLLRPEPQEGLVLEDAPAPFPGVH